MFNNMELPPITKVKNPKNPQANKSKAVLQGGGQLPKTTYDFIPMKCLEWQDSGDKSRLGQEKESFTLGGNESFKPGL